MANALLDSDFGRRLRRLYRRRRGPGLGQLHGKQGQCLGLSGHGWAALCADAEPRCRGQVRYFRTAKLNFGDAFAVNGINFTTNASGNFASNNVLASLVYNFNWARGGRSPPASASAAATASGAGDPDLSGRKRDRSDGGLPGATAAAASAAARERGERG